MAKETTTKFKVDISELRAGITEANRQIKLANAEFKAAASGMDDWQKSTEGISAKIKQLETVLDGENKKLANLKKQLELVEQEQGENSAGADELRIKIANQQAAVNKTAKSLSGYKSKLEDLEKQSEEATDASEDLADGLDDTKKAANDAEDAVKTMGEGFTVVKGAIANFIADGISNIISGIGNILEESREYRKEMALLDTSFQTSNLSATDAKNTYRELYGILGDSGPATEAAQHLAKISKNEQDLEKNTRILAGVMGEYGSSIPTEGLAEGMAATAAMGEVQGVLADALEWQGVNLDDFNAKLATMSTEEERASYIQETLLDLYGDSADAFMENNAAIVESNKANADLAATQAELGKTIEPLKTAWTNLKTQGLQWLIDNGLPALKSGWQWVKDNIPTIVALVGTFTAAWLTFGGAQKIVDGWNKLMAISQAALNAVMSANPIGLIVIAIGLLVTAFITLWNNCEGFREFFINLWETIKNAVSVAVEAISGFFVGLWDGIVGIFSTAATWFDETVIKPVVEFFTGMWSGLTQGATDAWNGVKEVFSKVTSFFGEVFGNAWKKVKEVFSKGGKVFDGIKDGIVSAFKTVVNALIKGINTVIKKPFEGLNKILDKIYGIEIAGIKPFSWLTWRAPVPQLPELKQGGVLKRGQVGLLEGDGAEAVVPLENNAKWIRSTARDLKEQMKAEGIVGTSGGPAVTNNNYNFTQHNTSPKHLSRLEIYRQTHNLLNFARG